MRKLNILLTVLALLLCCFGTARAQSKFDEVIANIQQAMKEMEPTWHCLSVPTPQGEPEPDSPRGTKYLFRCQKGTVDVSVFISNCESKRDAEKLLAWSQRLQVIGFKPVAGIGEQAYQLSKERFAWITFRKANVFTQVSVGVLNSPQTDSTSTSEIELVTADTLFDAARLFAHLVAQYVPVT